MALSDGLELENVELGALLGVVNPLDQTVVPLLESIHFEGSLLLESGSSDLLLSGFSVLFASFGLILAVGLLFGSHGLSVALLSSLDGSEELLLLDHLGLLTALGDSLLLLLVLLHRNAQTEVVIKLLLGLRNVGRSLREHLLEDLKGSLLRAESLAEVLHPEVCLTESLVA